MIFFSILPKQSPSTPSWLLGCASTTCVVPARPSCPSPLSLRRYLGPRHLGGGTWAHGAVHTSPHTAHPSCTTRATHAQKRASFLMSHALGG